jgi:hypothetical protein
MMKREQMIDGQVFANAPLQRHRVLVRFWRKSTLTKSCWKTKMSSSSAAILSKHKLRIGPAVILGGYIASSMMGQLLETLLSEQPDRSMMYFVALSISYLFGGFFTDTIAKEAPLRHAALSGSIAAIIPAANTVLTNRSIALTTLTSVFMLSAPIPLFVLGAYLDRLLFNLLLARSRRNQWSYVMSSGKAVKAFSPWQAPILANIWLLFAFVFWASFWVPCYWGECFIRENDGTYTHTTLVIPDSLVEYVLVGSICYIAAKRRKAVSVETLLAKDRRRPVIYLRPFGDDGKQMQGGLWYELSDSVRALRRKTIEQRLAKAFTKLGPFIAIGRPGELLPDLGAARMYVDNEVWQEVVEDLTSKAQLVILQAGETQGLQWELRKVGNTINPERVLLFVPFALKRRDREEVYGRFRAWAQTCFPGPLPERIGKVFFLYFECAPFPCCPLRRAAVSWITHALQGPSTLALNHPLHSTLAQLARDKAFNPRASLLHKVFFVDRLN